MTAELYLVVLVLVLASLFFIVPRIVGNWLKYRGTRIIICPETRRPAAVEVDTAHAEWSSLAGEVDLKLKSCTRWPEKKDCGQECLLQIEMAPDDCLARNMLTRWYEGKKCVYCGRQFEDVEWAAHKPVLMGPDRKTVEWIQIPPETIPDVLKTHLPVCWSCHMAETFRREHPDLFIDRDYDARAMEKAAKV